MQFAQVSIFSLEYPSFLQAEIIESLWGLTGNTAHFRDLAAAGRAGIGRLPGCSFSAWPGYGCCFFHSAVAGVLFSAWLGFGCCFFYSAVAGVFFSAWLGFRCCFFHSAVAGVLLSSLKEEPRKVPPISTRWTHDQGNLSPGPQPEDTLCRPANDRCSALPCGPRVRWVTHGCCR